MAGEMTWSKRLGSEAEDLGCSKAKRYAESVTKREVEGGWNNNS